MKKLYFVEITDTFGGEANYSWVTRHRRSGMSWHSVGSERYDSESGATCAFIRDYDPETDNDCMRLETDDRPTK